MFLRTGTKPDINQKVLCHVETVALLERGEGKEQGKVVKVECHCGYRALGHVWHQQAERFPVSYPSANQPNRREH